LITTTETTISMMTTAKTTDSTTAMTRINLMMTGTDV
jgi:hypothetical protein